MSLIEQYCNFYFSNQNQNKDPSGKGSSLFEVMNPRKTTKKLIQVKKLPRATKDLQELLKSGVILKKLKSHENILKFERGLVRRNRVFLEFEFVDFDLSQVLRSQTFTLTAQQKKFIFYQIVLGVAFLHENQVMHGNLCPNNILVDKDCKVKIGGLAEAHPKFLSKPEKLKNVFQNYYKAPETILNNESTQEFFNKPDIWALGCLFFELMEDKQVFHFKRQYLDLLKWVFKLLGKPSDQQVGFIKNNAARKWVMGSPKYQKKKPSSYLGQKNSCLRAKNLLDHMLRINPLERPSAKQILKHPYFKEIYDESDLEFGKVSWRSEDFRVNLHKQSCGKDLIAQISQIL